MAHGVELGPGGPELFWINPEPSGLLCSGLDSLGANWEGLDLTRMLCLGYSFIELWLYVCRVPGPSTTGIYNVHLLHGRFKHYLGVFCEVGWSN